MIFLSEAVVIEIVQREAPNILANCVELPVNLLVGPPEVKTL